MPLRVLVFHSEREQLQTLARFFKDRGDKIWQTQEADQALNLLGQSDPDLVLIDLHFPGQGWLHLLREIRKSHPKTRIIIASKYPDLQREMLAKEQGARVFLRQPFTRQWIESAVRRVNDETQPLPPKTDKEDGLVADKAAEKAATAAVVEPPRPAPAFGKGPRVRTPVRVKITFPYVMLALAFAIAGAVIISQVIFESVESRYKNQLISTGKQASDWMVQTEDRMLETLRLVANTQGMADAVRSGDAEALRQIALPLAVNSREDAIEILDLNGVSLLSLRHTPGGGIEEYTSTRGEGVFAEWPFVQYVLYGQVQNGQDKNAGMPEAPWGRLFYVSGPIVDAQGELVGVVLVGRSLSGLVRDMHEELMADITFYDISGEIVESSLVLPNPQDLILNRDLIVTTLTKEAETSISRDLSVADYSFSEVLAPWEVRGGTNLGIRGVALSHQYLVRTNTITRVQIYLLITIAFVAVIMTGVVLANQITRPLLKVVSASTEVAKGNLEVKVEPSGDDEVAVLAHSFNSMVAGLQEGSIYRDLLGRTVSPEVREQLRQTFTSGNVRLEGQEAVATVIMSDIRGFTTMSEQVDPATVFNWLNEYFGELVPLVTTNNGVVNKFDGDAMLAFFGILPKLLNPKQSAYMACKTAVEMMAAIEKLNIHRVERGEPPLSTGIGVNTGVVTAGGLGTTDRVHYTIIGDTVNTTQRLESLTRNLFSVSGALISQSTYNALGDYRSQFRLEPAGLHAVKGKAEQLLVYRLYPCTGDLKEWAAIQPSMETSPSQRQPQSSLEMAA